MFHAGVALKKYRITDARCAFAQAHIMAARWDVMVSRHPSACHCMNDIGSGTGGALCSNPVAVSDDIHECSVLFTVYIYVYITFLCLGAFL